MKKSRFILMAILVSYCSPARQDTGIISQPVRTINVQFNRNIEFLGFTFFLGAYGEQFEHTQERTPHQIPWQEWYAFGLALYQQYKSFRTSENLAALARFLEAHDGSDLIRLLLQLDDFPRATLTGQLADQYLLPFSPTQDLTEARAVVSQAIAAANAFYREINFDEYFLRNQNKYASARQQILARMPDTTFIPALEAFYQQSFDAYTLIPSLTIPTGMGFGATLTRGGSTEIYNVFGPLTAQHFADESHLDMGFGDEARLRELSTHEFGHSFVNPVIEALPSELLTRTETLYQPIETAMTDQGYPTWQHCLNEHFVRAGEVIIARNLGKPEDAAKLQHWYMEDRKFIYLPVILEELEKYNQDRTYPYAEAVRRAMKKLAAR
jgi:hypothetical protein